MIRRNFNILRLCVLILDTSEMLPKASVVASLLSHWSFLQGFSTSMSVKNIGSFNFSQVINADNRKKCVECLQNTPVIRMTKSKSSAQAAILIPICINNVGQPSLLYTRRSGLLSRHVRQISFPGGIKDDTDASFEDCALRETEEEIGLKPSRVEIWGTGTLIRPQHTAAIMPVIGSVENFSLDELVINKHEVDEAFTVPLEELCSLVTKKHTQFKTGYSSPVFIAGDGKYKIWGITGFITQSFMHCLLPGQIFSHKIEFIKPYSR